MSHHEEKKNSNHCLRQILSYSNKNTQPYPTFVAHQPVVCVVGMVGEPHCWTSRADNLSPPPSSRWPKPSFFFSLSVGTVMREEEKQHETAYRLNYVCLHLLTEDKSVRPP